VKSDAHGIDTGTTLHPPPSTLHPPLKRHFGLFQATALNITQIVGAGIFVTIPLMLKELPGPYALLGWLVAGVLIVFDGMIWSELGATLPGSGGTYLYMLECFGRERWGRLMAFLFIWQFLISGPLELGSGLIAMAQFSGSLTPRFSAFDERWTTTWTLWESQDVTVVFGPTRVIGLLAGLLIIFLLYRRIAILGRLTVTISLGVIGVIAWILIEGMLHGSAGVFFDFSGAASTMPVDFWGGLGGAMRLATYSYLGYYSVCYIGDEVRDPGRTIPRSILLSAVLVCGLFVALHMAMLGVVNWHEVPLEKPEVDTFSLAAEFMKRLHDPWAVTLVTVLLMWSCFGSAFAGMLAYSRIPFGAARYGHFFGMLGRVHPNLAIPHISLLFVGILTLVWSFFGLQTVIDALVTTRILEQFVAQCFGVVLLRWKDPDRPRPYRMWLYPLPCALALVGWLYMYLSARGLFIALGLGTLGVGVLVFSIWSAVRRPAGGSSAH
jgi:amino acid transporter